MADWSQHLIAARKALANAESYANLYKWNEAWKFTSEAIQALDDLRNSLPAPIPLSSELENAIRRAQAASCLPVGDQSTPTR